jgi:hypothetical protein
LDQLSDDFPEDYFKMKILPELLKSVEFGGGGPKVFGVVMKISKKLTDEEFEAKVTPAVVRLFSSPDRAIRVCLLDNLPLMIDRLPQKVVNDKIFPQMVCFSIHQISADEDKRLPDLRMLLPLCENRLSRLFSRLFQNFPKGPSMASS